MYITKQFVLLLGPWKLCIVYGFCYPSRKYRNSAIILALSLDNRLYISSSRTLQSNCLHLPQDQVTQHCGGNSVLLE